MKPIADVRNEADPSVPREPKRTRAAILRLFGIGAAGFAAGAATNATRDAAASDGTPVVAGVVNSADSKTQLTTAGTITNDGAFVVTAPNADWAVEGTSTQIGALGGGFIGVMGTGDIGGFFSGALAALSLQPQLLAGAPTSGDYSMGDLLVDANGVLFLCVADGNPGNWTRISDRGTHLLDAPTRAYDSRDDPRGRFAQDEERELTIAGNFGVPPDATALVGNITVTGTHPFGNGLAYPTGVARPLAASINWFGEGQTLNTALTVGLGTAGRITLYAAMPTHMIIDVSGYIR